MLLAEQMEKYACIFIMYTEKKTNFLLYNSNSLETKTVV